MTVASSPLANALRAIRPLAAVTAHSRPKTPAEMLRDVAAIQLLALDALTPITPPAPVPLPSPVVPPPIVPPIVPPIPPVVPPTQPPPQPIQAVLRADWRYPNDVAFRAALAGFRARHPELLSLDPSVPYQGHASLRYDQPAGSAASPELHPRFATPQSDVWLRAVIRFEPGFTTKGTKPNTANSFKLLGLDWPDGKRAPASAGGKAITGRSTVEISNTDKIYFGGGEMPGTPIVKGAIGAITTEWIDGAFWDYRIHYRRVDETTATLRLWRSRDGQPPALVATRTLKTSQPWATVPWCDGVFVGLNFNQIRVSAQSLWVGLIEVIAGGNPWSL